MTDIEKARREIEELRAKEDAARKDLEALQFANANRIKELNAQLRESDLETVRKLCTQHGFTATELRGALKGRGRTKKIADMITDGTNKRPGRPKGSKNKTA